MKLRPLAAVALAVAAGVVVVALSHGERPAADNVWTVRAGVELQFETVEGVRLRYVRRGQGPPVVLLHGLASSIYTWTDVLPALATSAEVVALDLPGFGGSDLPVAVSGADLPRLVLAFLDRLGLERVAMVGHSLGGAVAAVVAARAPARVERLVLIDAAGFNLAPEDRPWLLRVAGWGPAAGLLERLGVRRALLELGLRQVFYDPRHVTPERVEAYLAPLQRPGAAAFLTRLLSEEDRLGLPGVLREVRAPTLVVWGRQDAWVPLRDADRFLAAIPDARKAVIEDCGHMPQEEKPAELARILREFLGPGAGPATLRTGS